VEGVGFTRKVRIGYNFTWSRLYFYLPILQDLSINHLLNHLVYGPLGLGLFGLVGRLMAGPAILLSKSSRSGTHGAKPHQIANVDHDLWQLAYKLVKVRSYGRYDINGFWFHSTAFEAFCPLVATTNSWVVMRAINAEGRKTKYYGTINKILEFSFVGNKELKVVFFDCDWFDNNNRTCQNQFGMVEVKQNKRLRGYDTFILAHQLEQVYYLPYPCEKLSAWWVVHKVNPHEWLLTSGDAGYHDTPTLDDDVDEVYQEEELPASFIIDLGVGLDDLVGESDDIQMSVVT
jgi:hypothetical protein